MNALTQNNAAGVPVRQENHEDTFARPEVDIHETAAGYVLLAEMPGVAREGLDITVEDNQLTLTGRRAVEPATKSEALLRESHGLDYRRVFDLSPEIDRDRITAGVEQGLVTVTLPKAQRAQPRKIEVR